MVTPAERGKLSALKEAGFTGYLIKPVRAASLAVRFLTADGFDNGGCGEPVETPDTTITGNGLRILCAEDNEINALLIRALLEKRSPADHGGKRHGSRRMLARSARGRHAVRSRADGPAYARNGRA
jgi:hypothetical protein